MKEKGLKNKLALVCGGSDGLGFGSAYQLASAGAELIITGRSEGKLREKKKELDRVNNKDNKTLCIDFDRTDEVKRIISELVIKAPIQILVNNCGGPPPGKLILAEPSKLLKAFNQHIIASHIISTLLIPGMESSGYGRIINIISTSVRQPIPDLGISNTIRGAMASWSKTLSNELASTGITVNNILPGTTKTGRLENILSARQKKFNISREEAKNQMLDQIPMGRFAEVEEISKAILFLASPDASYITGTNLQVDGGKIRSI